MIPIRKTYRWLRISGLQVAKASITESHRLRSLKIISSLDLSAVDGNIPVYIIVYRVG